MDSVQEFDPTSFAETAFKTEAAAAHDAAEAKLAAMQRRMKRKLAAQKRQAQAAGLLDGVLSQIGAGDIVIDCGAGVGLTTRRLAATGATVYAFEPDPTAFAQLEKRCGDLPNVQLVQAAVGDADGSRMVEPSKPLDAEAEGAGLLAASEPVEVPEHDLAAIVADVLDGREPGALPSQPGLFRRGGSIAFLKLNIDGAEVPVMQALHDAGLLERVRCAAVTTHERKHGPAKRRQTVRMRRRMAKQYKASHVFLDWV